MRIVAEELSRSFGNTLALSDVSIALDPGKVHALVGENGAGKSTLLKILAGAERPDSGRMALDGQPYAPRSVTEATRRGVGLVFQEITINPSLTVAENIFAGQLARFRRYGLLRRGGLNRAAQACLTASRLRFRSRSRCPALDLGQWKCIEVARALVGLAPGCAVRRIDGVSQSSRGRHRSRRDAGAQAARPRCRFRLAPPRRGRRRRRRADDPQGRTQGRRLRRPTSSAASRSRASWLGATCRRASFRPTRRDAPPTISCASRTSRTSASSRARSRLAAARSSGSPGSREPAVSASWRSPPASRRCASGEMRLSGAPFRPRIPADAWAKGVAYLPGDRTGEGLIVGASVLDNLVMARPPRRGPLFDHAQARKRFAARSSGGCRSRPRPRRHGRAR